MGLGSLMTFVTLLLKKLRSAAPEDRAVVKGAIKEAQDTGLIPLGTRSDDGGPAYVWLLFDRSRLTLGERERYVRAKTPLGVRTRTIEI